MRRDRLSSLSLALDAYVARVQRSGWQDVDLVRFGCLAHVALSHTIGVIHQAAQLAEKEDSEPERLVALLGRLEYLLSLVDPMWELARMSRPC